MLDQTVYREFLGMYSSRIQEADTSHSGKFEAMRDAANFMRQILPEISESKLNSEGEAAGNNNSSSNRSKYSPPVMLAIYKKMLEDLTASPVDFEYSSNGKGGREKADAFMNILKRTYTQGNVSKEMQYALFMGLSLGTIVAQPFMDELKEDYLDKDMKVVTLASGKGPSFISYDTMKVLIDPNAVPHNVQDTAEWVVVTLGRRSVNYIKSTYDISGIELQVDDSDTYNGGKSSTTLVVDTYQKELEQDAGLDLEKGLMLREYYDNKGMVYTILEDMFVVKKAVNFSRTYGKIPFVWCPLILDAYSPYGIPMLEELRPSVELVATAINMVADNTAARNKLPWVTPKGLIDDDSMALFTSGQYNNFNSILEINTTRLELNPSITVREIKSLFQKPDIQEVTEGAMFLFNEGMNNIWLISGLNPTAMSGRQEKQIRLKGVADMINESSLRNSSNVVKNLDSYFMNPMCKAFQTMFYIEYDSFSEFKSGEVEIPKDVVGDLKNIRIVPGSYLPADQMGRMQKAAYLMSRALANQYSYDPVKVERYGLNAMGFTPEDFFRDPLQLFDQRQTMQIVQMIEQMGPEGFAQYAGQMNQQKTQEAQDAQRKQ